VTRAEMYRYCAAEAERCAVEARRHYYQLLARPERHGTAERYGMAAMLVRRSAADAADFGAQAQWWRQRAAEAAEHGTGAGA